MKEEALFNQAKICLDQGDYEQAIALLEKCIEAEEDEVNYYWCLGLAYFFNREYEKSESIWMSSLLEQQTLNIESLVNFLVQFIESITFNLSRFPHNTAKILNTYRLYGIILENFPEYQNQYLNQFLEQNLKFITQLIEEDIFENKIEEVINNYQNLIFSMMNIYSFFSFIK